MTIPKYSFCNELYDTDRRPIGRLWGIGLSVNKNGRCRSVGTDRDPAVLAPMQQVWALNSLRACRRKESCRTMQRSTSIASYRQQPPILRLEPSRKIFSSRWRWSKPERSTMRLMKPLSSRNFLSRAVLLLEVVVNNVSYLQEDTFQFKVGRQHTLSLIINSNPDQVPVDIGGEIVGGRNW